MTKANKQALAAAGCALALLPLLAGALVPRDIPAPPARQGSEIGRASCRERV